MSIERRGLLAGAAAYVIWGVFPIYWRSLGPATPYELLAHRVLWSMIVVGVVITVVRRWNEVRIALSSWRNVVVMILASLMIGANWGIFIWAVNNDHTVEASLGYFINPLVSVLLGVSLLGERLRGLQWLAVGIATAAVIVLTVEVGGVPWTALGLAFSFGCYGLLKKLSPTKPLSGLLVETIVLAPLAIGFLGYLLTTDVLDFGRHGTWHAIWIISMGAVTAVPLVLFAVAAQSIPLSTLGLLQYIAPVLQFLIGVYVFGEPMPVIRWVGFAIVWVALAIFTADAIRHTGRVRRFARPVPDAAAPLG